MNTKFMNDDVLKLLIQASKKIAFAKKELAVMAEHHPIEYMKIREILNNIVDDMAKYCKCPPTKLIFGKMEEIKSGLKKNCT